MREQLGRQEAPLEGPFRHREQEEEGHGEDEPVGGGRQGDEVEGGRVLGDVRGGGVEGGGQQDEQAGRQVGDGLQEQDVVDEEKEVVEEENARQELSKYARFGRGTDIALAF